MSSRLTQGTAGECAEVARLVRGIGVRDSKRQGHGYLTLTP
ncbi:DUF397 domain-containing protein [Spirillospora sp. NPDC048823]